MGSVSAPICASENPCRATSVTTGQNVALRGAQGPQMTSPVQTLDPRSAPWTASALKALVESVKPPNPTRRVRWALAKAKVEIIKRDINKINNELVTLGEEL